MDRPVRLCSLISVWLLAALALAGCTSGGGDDGGAVQGPEDDGRPAANLVEGIGPEFVVLKRVIDATQCGNMELLVPVSKDHAQDLLPDPFVPAPDPLTGEDAAMVVEVLACESAEHEPSGGYKRAWVGVLVEAPTLPEPAREFERENRTQREQADHASDVYALAGYVQAQEFQRFLRQSGVPYAQSWIDIETFDAAEVHVVQVAVEDREQDVQALEFVGGAAAAADESSIEHRSWWATTQRGVQLFEEVRTSGDGGAVQYHAGGSGCLVADDGLFANLFPATGCNPASLRFATGLDTRGHSLWFHDTKVLE